MNLKSKEMTKKERLQAELTKLKTKLTDLIKKDKLIHSCPVRKQIEEKQQAIKNCEYYEYQPLNEVVSRDELTKNKVYAKLFEIALAADYLADCAIECKEVLPKLGVGNFKPIGKCTIQELQEELNKRLGK